MTSTDVAVKAQTEVATPATPATKAPRYSAEQVAAANIGNQTDLPALAEAPKHFIPLSVEYWSPQVEGEEKLVYVAGVDFHDVPDMETGEIRAVECVLLLEQQDNTLCRFISASRVLVGNIKDAITRGDIIPMTTLTPVSITFMGQKKNRSNAKLSNRWKIVPIIVGVQ